MDEKTFRVAMVERLIDLLDLLEDKKQSLPQVSTHGDPSRDDVLEMAATSYLTRLLTIDISQEPQ
jgi:hypothetical protein